MWISGGWRALGRPQETAGEGDPLIWIPERLDFHPDALQARVLKSQSRRGILNCARQWGKSSVAAAKAVHHACTQAESLTLVLSPSGRQSSEFLRKCGKFLVQANIRPKGDGDNEISLALPNGSRIVGLPATEATIRGFSAVSLLLVDEASRVKDEVYQAVRPMLATTDGALWLMSTPWAKRGFFWEAWTKGGPEWERIKATGPECPRIKPHHLEAERRDMSERCYRREYLCEFDDTASSIFGRDIVERAFSKNVPAMKFALR